MRLHTPFPLYIRYTHRYVSDKPHAHAPSVLGQVAFRDGSVPRPVRNARPVGRAIFLDPQNRAGDPLLVQSRNPAKGLVVGAVRAACLWRNGVNGGSILASIVANALPIYLYTNSTLLISAIHMFNAL